ncbi:MAG: Uma2 family endonuclease [Cytophagaceae bacterium]|nr:Uma2 family endonuclease [Cytophagaceae bacterium]MBK9511845.1 Uma2 family endonuclease [Cytophagaceae bacterium]MBK9934602.1 Uma2 family endonuclease [Cytophagaceae bacterium]MBL0301041.1 Uma2 family endonuclease [Cytophagaceae bacterium]MBL0323860.1 Uma2 family endonuclease [Cytophagaceae bacterium]
MEITSLSQLDLSKTYSYADYFSWKFQERVELLRGKIMKMSPAPSRQHQRISSKLGFSIQKSLELSSCQVFYAPFDVRLESVKDDKLAKTVVQPDICVICDLTKLDDRGCSGAPELIVEILSPGNTAKEMKHKFKLYEEAGVEEYWIVDPTEKIVWQYHLENGIFTNHRPLIEEDVLHSLVLKGFSIELSAVFSD